MKAWLLCLTGRTCDSGCSTWHLACIAPKQSDSLYIVFHCRWARALTPVLRALLTALQGGCVTLRRCDVAAADEPADAAGGADVMLHAGGVLRVSAAPEP
jgi:hypothetical protein